ncbi:melanization protease 1 [Drosophila santomea]|uniref:melanization protease 1 n=1 Tax=Drosophila santomea TaxID=129105 RepID=UPI0019546380|nr:melanization protease 1 [Drosophila santomea]
MTLRTMSSSIIGIAVLGCLWLRVQGFQLLLEEDCGVAHRISQRSVDAKLMQHPWMAYLETPKGYHCAGTLVNHWFVLTAAHCVPDDLQITVRLGEYNTGTKLDCVNHRCQEAHQEYDVDMGFRHKSYNADNQTNDIGMLRLGRRVEYSLQIRPICIFASNRWEELIEKFTWFTATIWRETAPNATSKVLQTIDIERHHPQKPSNTDICLEIYGRNTTYGQMCAGSKMSHLCSSDSGAPQTRIMWHNNSDRMVQLGIASWAKGKCEDSGILTDLSSYASWIKRVVRQHGPSADMDPHMTEGYDETAEFYNPV